MKERYVSATAERRCTRGADLGVSVVMLPFGGGSRYQIRGRVPFGTEHQNSVTKQWRWKFVRETHRVRRTLPRTPPRARQQFEKKGNDASFVRVKEMNLALYDTDAWLVGCASESWGKIFDVIREKWHFYVYYFILSIIFLFTEWKIFYYGIPFLTLCHVAMNYFGPATTLDRQNTSFNKVKMFGQHCCKSMEKILIEFFFYRYWEFRYYDHSFYIV